MQYIASCTQLMNFIGYYFICHGETHTGMEVSIVIKRGSVYLWRIVFLSPATDSSERGYSLHLLPSHGCMLLSQLTAVPNP